MKKVRAKFKLTGDILGLDLGMRRTGVARINTVARMAEPLDEIVMRDGFVEQVAQKISRYQSTAVVVGLPRGLDGQVTDQTRWTETIIQELRQSLDVPVFTIDEAGTTIEAEKRVQDGQSVDSVAAGLLLEDFIKEVSRGRIEQVNL